MESPYTIIPVTTSIKPRPPNTNTKTFVPPPPLILPPVPCVGVGVGDGVVDAVGEGGGVFTSTAVWPFIMCWLYKSTGLPAITTLAKPQKKHPQQTSKIRPLESLVNTLQLPNNITSFQQYKRWGAETCNFISFVTSFPACCFHDFVVAMLHREQCYLQPQHSEMKCGRASEA